MNINNIRLAFNLFFKPVVIFVLATITTLGIERLESQPMLRSLVPIIQWGASGLFVAATFILGWSIWKISQAVRGVGELCYGCGMPTRYLSPGKYSPYYRCMACGMNRRA